MKTITIDDEIYRKLSEAKATLNARSFSEALRKILSQDRISWVTRLAGKIKVDEKEMANLEKGWKSWPSQ